MSQYPKVRLVYGDLDNVELLEEEAKKADIVISKPSSAAVSSIDLNCVIRLGRLRPPCRNERPDQRRCFSTAGNPSFHNSNIWYRNTHVR